LVLLACSRLGFNKEIKMILFECMIDLSGTWRKVQITAERDQAAYEMLCAQYGSEAVKGWPHPV
jgi:hypothetical protein